MTITVPLLLSAAAALAAAALALAGVAYTLRTAARSWTTARDRARARAATRAQGRADAGRPARTWLDGLFAAVVAGLFAVAVLGAAISFTTLRREATAHLDSAAAGIAFPFLADAWIAFATGAYVVRARQGKRRPGYKLVAYAAIVATIVLNAQGTDGPAGLLWHVWPPAIWAAFLELIAADAIATARREGLDERYVPLDRLTGADWLNPIRTLRLLAHRRATGIPDLTDVARSLAMTDAAVLTVRRALPITGGWFAWEVRRTIIRNIRTRQLDPRDVLALTRPAPAAAGRTRRAADPDALLRAALGKLPQEPTAPDTRPARPGPRLPPRRHRARTRCPNCSTGTPATPGTLTRSATRWPPTHGPGRTSSSRPAPRSPPGAASRRAGAAGWSTGGGSWPTPPMSPPSSAPAAPPGSWTRPRAPPSPRPRPKRPPSRTSGPWTRSSPRSPDPRQGEGPATPDRRVAGPSRVLPQARGRTPTCKIDNPYRAGRPGPAGGAPLARLRA